MRTSQRVVAVAGCATALAAAMVGGGSAQADGFEQQHVVEVGGPRIQSCPAPSGASFYTDQPAEDLTFDTTKSRNYSRGIAGETSLGALPHSPTVLMQMNLTTAAVDLPESGCPEASSWRNVSPPQAIFTNDPWLWVDPVTGRTVLTHLDGPSGAAVATISDDGGRTWSTGEPPYEQPSLDHQGVASGPYAIPPVTLPGRATPARAFYYCAKNDHVKTFFVPGDSELPGKHGQDQCMRSDDGGATWGPPVLVNADTVNNEYCNDAAGKVSVSQATGTVFFPIVDCHDHQGVAVSRDNGQTWQLSIIRSVQDEFPGDGDNTTNATHDTSAVNYGHNFGDAKVAVDAAGTVYFSTVNAGHPSVVMSRDDGRTWSAAVDVGAPLGIQNAVFPDAIAGDAGRVAVMFYGTEHGGDIESVIGADGLPTSWVSTPWYLYLATSLDGGQTWRVENVTPADPVQRGCIAAYRGDAPVACTNLYDFQDMTIDSAGHVLISYADGCVTAACTSPTGTYVDSNASQGYLARQLSGPALILTKAVR